MFPTTKEKSYEFTLKACTNRKNSLFLDQAHLPSKQFWRKENWILTFFISWVFSLWSDDTVQFAPMCVCHGIWISVCYWLHCFIFTPAQPSQDPPDLDHPGAAPVPASLSLVNSSGAPLSLVQTWVTNNQSKINVTQDKDACNWISPV